MNRSNLHLILAFIGLCLLWFLWPNGKETEVFTKNDSKVFYPSARIQKEKGEEEKTKSTNLPKEPSSAEIIKQQTPKSFKGDKYSFFKKKIKNKAFVKIVDGVALTGGDQIVGFANSEQNFDAESFYKSSVGKSLLWTDSIVPYGFADGFPRELFDSVGRAIDYFNNETDLRFVEFDKNQDTDAIIFTFRPRLSCSSYVGRIGGLQQIFLNFDCNHQSILHEIMHALGFVHEQQLPYRDEYVDILWENISEESVHNFAQAPEVWTAHYFSEGLGFDYHSIMLYHDAAFARPGMKSMVSKTDHLIAPSTQGLSVIDLERLNILY